MGSSDIGIQGRYNDNGKKNSEAIISLQFPRNL